MNAPELADFMFENAKKIVESGRAVVAMLGVFHDGGMKFVPIPWRSPREKTVVLAFIRHMLAEDDAIKAYAIVSEAWMSNIPAGAITQDLPMPRDDPKRIESLIVTAYGRSGEGITLLAEIRTEEGARTVNEPERWQAGEMQFGQMVNLFEPGKVGH
jgi:hypothetical protein